MRLSRQFTELLDEHTRNKDNQSKASKDALMFLKQKVDAAQGFINAVKQRQHTLLTTMQAIIDIQRLFFLEGDESLLKPMILKDVAERGIGYFHHITGKQQQICTNKLWYLFVEILFQRRLHHRRR